MSHSPGTKKSGGGVPLINLLLFLEASKSEQIIQSEINKICFLFFCNIMDIKRKEL